MSLDVAVKEAPKIALPAIHQLDGTLAGADDHRRNALDGLRFISKPLSLGVAAKFSGI
ncbi:hypothetical protein [Rhizobium ruizarguesonis]|uniref:hypothetical protein n=1 Tax=Rhizobium ruizarguesonis TaxID=2081791 RepID=UPI0013EF20F0|nr:hypothetical protein [Rhizobium ruizarguesonis]